MKKLWLAALFLLAGLQVNAQDVAGNWLGVVNVGIDLHLGFNIKKVADTAYTVTFDSPDQKAFGIPAQIQVKKDSLFIKIPAIGGGYAGAWDGKDGMTGTFMQGIHKLPLNLSRISDAQKAELNKPIVRPQTPKPPYNYYTEDVEYDNADKSLHYGATFTRPNGSGKYPAVIIISGSGTQDRDGTMLGHKVYWVLADYLSSHGIAVLRVDDRGAGKSTTGGFTKPTSLDFSYDVETSLNYLESRPDVDLKHLGLIGHSEGGIIAPMVAARRKDVSFVVLWGAPAIGGAKVIAAQNYHSLKNNGLGAASLNAFLVLQEKIFSCFKAPDTAAFDKQVQLFFEAWKKQQSPTVLDTLKVKGNSIIGSDLYHTYNSLFNTPWVRFFINYDPAKDLSQLKCSVLAINGAKDTQVNPKDNLGRINQVLSKSGNKDFKTVEIPNLNHLLQDADTGDASEYIKIDETMSPVAMNIISEWIKIHTR